MGYEETRAAFTRTLERLETDYLDVYMIHWPKPCENDPDWKERDLQTWKALTELKKEGKIRHLGMSNFLPHHLNNIFENSDCAP